MDKSNMRYDPNKPICKRPDEIDAYIKSKGIEIQHWVVEEQIYWQEYNGKPVYTSMK